MRLYAKGERIPNRFSSSAIWEALNPSSRFLKISRHNIGSIFVYFQALVFIADFHITIDGKSTYKIPRCAVLLPGRSVS